MDSGSGLISSISAETFSCVCSFCCAITRSVTWRCWRSRRSACRAAGHDGDVEVGGRAAPWLAMVACAGARPNACRACRREQARSASRLFGSTSSCRDGRAPTGAAADRHPALVGEADDAARVGAEDQVLIALTNTSSAAARRATAVCASSSASRPARAQAAPGEQGHTGYDDGEQQPAPRRRAGRRRPAPPGRAARRPRAR